MGWFVRLPSTQQKLHFERGALAVKSLNIVAVLATAAFLAACNQNAGGPADAPEAGAPDVNVNVPPADAPDINVAPPADAPDVNITTPPADGPDVNINPPAEPPPAQ
jgi:hypothetical protein